MFAHHLVLGLALNLTLYSGHQKATQVFTQAWFNYSSSIRANLLSKLSDSILVSAELIPLKAIKH